MMIHFHKYVMVRVWQGVMKAWDVKVCVKCGHEKSRKTVLDMAAGTYTREAW